VITIVLINNLNPTPMEFFTNNCDAIISLLISGILGVLGQGLRVWVGLNKLYNKKNSLTVSKDVVDNNRMLGSIFIGFCIGVLLAFLTGTLNKEFTIDKIIAFVACGYAITDLTENIFSVYFKKQESKSSFTNLTTTESHSPDENKQQVDKPILF
jgi:ABC-type uncharacterized transport system permease subunit